MRSQTRRVAVVTGNGEIAVREQSIPTPGEHEVLVKVHASLISPGTEIALVKRRRTQPDAKVEEIAFGYANAGEVIAGDGLSPGTRVAAMGGGYAVHGTHAGVPINLLVPIPDKVTYAQAAYACLAATALQSVRRTEPQLGEFGAVLGLGIVGNLAAQFYRLSGARVIGWEGFERRIEIARQCGIAPTVNFRTQDAAAITRQFAEPYGLDFANFAFGGEATDVFQSVVTCMKRSPDTHQMGRIVLVGGCEVKLAGGANLGNLDIRAASRTGPGYHDPAWEQGADYPNALVPFTTRRNLREIIRLMEEGRLIVDPMTTHELPLREVAAAVDLLVEHPDQALGVILNME